MAKINVLTPDIYNYIAAGEVVERPASVIKELVENSIDAGATIIEIEVEGGGIEKMRVTDNGMGVEESELPVAFMPHATSKIASVKDLDSIFTLGFRGEALASIASVAKVTMTSKPKSQPHASTITIEGGKVKSTGQTGAKDGTTTVVTDLFYCVPARQKFLKKPKTEEQEITNLVSRFILAHPKICFSYSADGKVVFQSSGTNLKEAMFAVYGKSATTETLPIDLKKDDYSVTGYIGRPSCSKPNRTYQTLIINGRYVINQTVNTAITNAYGEMLMKRRYPFFVLELRLPTGSVDVNVHPNKLDVRFENQNRIYSLFFEAVSRALSQMDYVASAEDKELDKDFLNTLEKIDSGADINVSPVVPAAVPQSPAPKIDKAGVNLNKNPFSANPTFMNEESRQDFKRAIIDATIDSSVSHESNVKDGFGLGSKLLERLSDTSSDKASSNYYKEEKVTQNDLGIEASIKRVGKVFNTYLILEVDNDMFFIDQHAAHERILYEKFKREYDNKNIIIQPLLFPYVLSLNPLESGILSENLDILSELGFEVEEFGKNTFKVNAVPALVSEMNFDTFFSEFLSDTKNTIKKSSDLIKEYLMQHSCKSAIKGGNDLSDLEIQTLYKEMSKEKIALFCPHGRPIAIRISKQEMEKWFKRIV